MEPTPKQALALWRMLTADRSEVAEPKVSDIKPELTVAERTALIDGGYVTTRKGRNRARHLVPTDKVWDWAARSTPMTVLKSRSPVGAEVLENLLNRLLPNLKAQGLALAEVLRPPPTTDPSPRAVDPTPAQRDGSQRAVADVAKKHGAEVLSAVQTLARRSKSGAVRLAALRAELSSLARAEVDRALRALRDDGFLILYQDDDRASLTEADHQAALVEASTPHHLVYLENR